MTTAVSTGVRLAGAMHAGAAAAEPVHAVVHEAARPLAGFPSAAARAGGQRAPSVDVHAGAAAIGSTPARGGDEVLRLRSAIRMASDAPIAKPSDLVRAADAMLGELARRPATRLAREERAQLAGDAGLVLRRFGGLARSGVVLPEPLRLRMATRYERAGRTLDGDGITLAAASGPALPELLRADRSDFLRRLDRISQVAHLDDLDLMRFAAANELRAGTPIARGDTVRSRQLRQAWTSVAGAARRLGAQGQRADASADAALVARAERAAPAHVPWNDLTDRLLGDAAVRPSGGRIDAALQRVFAPRHDDRVVARLGVARAAAALTAPEPAAAERVRHHAAGIAQLLDASDGETHVVSGLPTYVGSLAGLLDEFEAVPAELREVTSHALVDDTLGELGRGLAAMRDVGAQGQLPNERLWPNRGRVGRITSNAALLASMHEYRAASGAI